QIANRLGERGAPGLARDERIEPERSEASGETLELGGLARALAALEGDEPARHSAERCAEAKLSAPGPRPRGAAWDARRVRAARARSRSTKAPGTWRSARPRPWS